jgi:NADH dehydrogenase
MGVEVRTHTRVTSIDAGGATCGEERFEASTVLWAAGVKAAALGATLGVPVDRAGRIAVEQDCSVPGHPNVFCIGDAAAFVPDGEKEPLPGVSPVAMQEGRFVARQIARAIEDKPRETFVYRDKGIMATIGRSRAVARIGRVRLSGFVAWAAWLLLHIVYLIDFRNRVLVLFDWAWSYFTYERGSRLITGRRLDAGTPSTGPASLPAQESPKRMP